MANIYGAYLINVTDNGGQSSHQKFNMERIEDHSILKLYVAKSPEKIWFEVLEPSSSDEPYEGLLVNAPKDKSYFVELKDLDQEAVRKLGALAPQHIAEFGPPHENLEYHGLLVEREQPMESGIDSLSTNKLPVISG